MPRLQPGWRHPAAAGFATLCGKSGRIAPPAATAPARGWLAGSFGAGLPREFFLFACAASLTTGGLVTFGLIGYHLSVGGLAPVAQVPVIYSGAMLTEALAALGVGWLYDRVGPSVLYAVPVLVAVPVPVIVPLPGRRVLPGRDGGDGLLR